LPDATWHEALSALPAGPLLLVANEFLDALPVRQFVWRNDAWMERFVDNGKFVELPHPSAPTPRRRGAGGKGQAVVELNEPAQAVARSLGARLSQHPGAALFLDYGPARCTPGDSLQALRDGQPADPLSPPGSADITAHVDFETFATTARAAGAITFGPLPQGVFLTRLGLFQRTDRLARNHPPLRAVALIDAARRLAEPNRMGRLFKALALASAGCATPPGFE